MKNDSALLLTALAALGTLAAGAPGAHAEDEILLFDGKTLSGWTLASGKPITTGWEVAEGAIHRKSHAGDIVTTRTFANFLLEFEFKAAPGTNSGVKYRYGNYGGQQIGLEYQILDDARTNAAPPTKHTTASLYDFFAPAIRKPRPATEWNRGKIVVRGDRIEHWLNGEKVVSVTLGSPEWKAALQKSKFRKQQDFGTKPGPILLQDHGGEVWFKNLRLRELKPEGG